LVALPFPKEIVVVGDGIEAQFGNQAGEGDAEGEIHGDGQGIFNHNQVKMIAPDKPAQGSADLIGDGVDFINQLFNVSVVRVFAESPLGESNDGLMVKVKLGDQVAAAGIFPQLAGAIEKLVPHAAENFSPLFYLQRNPIGSIQSG
jgi:hypothetical protein